MMKPEPFPPEGKKSRRPLIVGLAVATLVAVGLGVALGVVLSGRKNDEEKNIETHETRGEDDELTVAGFTSSEVRSACSVQSLETDEGSDLCDEACEAAGCCDPLALGEEDNDCDLGTCVSLAACHVATSTSSFLDRFVGGDVDVAPENLAELCSGGAIEDDPSACEEACAPAACCHAENEFERCHIKQFLTCLDYAHCQNLRNDTRVAPAPHNLDEICGIERDDNQECANVCMKNTCCLIPADTAGSCLHSDFISCATYAWCGGLFLPPINSAVEPPPDNLTDICSLDNIFMQSENRNKCVEACEEAACCGSLIGNCFEDDPFGCMEYAPCAALPLTGGSLSHAPDNLTEMCSLETLTSAPGAGDDCANACEDAMCCVAPGDENCFDDGNFLACSEYLVCATLLIEGGGLEDPPENITDVCSWDNVQDAEGCAECKNLCNTASCCVTLGEGNCLAGNLETCAKWALSPCVLSSLCKEDEDDTPSLPPDDLPPTGQASFTHSSSFVRSVCSQDNLLTANGTSSCQDVCVPASGCDPLGNDAFVSDDVRSCVAYSACHTVTGDGIAPAPSNISLICSAEVVAEDPLACEEACAPAACCHADNEFERCHIKQFLTCLDYAHCQNLRNSTKVVPAPPDIDEICGIDRDNNAECISTCMEAACCLIPPDTAGSCLHSDFISCATYAWCGGLFLPPINSAVEPPPDNLTDICSLDNIFMQSENRNKCVEACEEAACCGSLIGNCFEDDPFGCMEYAPCAALPLTGGSLSHAPDNLTEMCSLETLTSAPGAGDDCANACEDAMCCVAPGDENCLDDGNFLACSEYLVCATLLIEGGGLEDPPENITDVCSWDNVQDAEGCAECKNLCNTASCCVTLGEGNCLAGNLETCAKWALSPCLLFGSCG